MKSKILIALLVIAVQYSFAQNEDDALRYALQNPGGSARFASMGGAFGALGGDISSFTYNPAGIGVYRSNEFSLTTSYTKSDVNTKYYNNPLSSTVSKLALSSIGFVTTIPSMPNDDWKSLSFGFTYNQTMNFNRRVHIAGENSIESRLFKEEISMNESFDEYNPFYKTNLIQEYGNGFWSDYDTTANSIVNNFQDFTLRESGYGGEYNMAIGGNYMDQVYIGGSLGITYLGYNQYKTYNETPNNTVPYLIDFSDEITLKTSAVGINLKLGAIYRINNIVRAGLAIHTPTFYSISEQYTRTTIGNRDNGADIITTNKYESSSEADYQLNAPGKIIPSIAFVFGKFGLLSVDYEAVRYHALSFSVNEESYGDNMDNFNSDEAYYSNVNQWIDDTYTWGNNVRIGGELKLGMVSLRGGYAFYQSPFKSSYENKDAHLQILSAGTGIQLGNVIFDVAYKKSLKDEKYFVYGTADSKSSIKNDASSILASLKFKF